MQESKEDAADSDVKGDKESGKNFHATVKWDFLHGIKVEKETLERVSSFLNQILKF